LGPPKLKKISYKKKFLYFVKINQDSSMEIDINQAKISIGDKYKVFIDGQQTHAASRQLFSFLPVVHLYAFGDEQPRMTIAKKLSLLKAKYDITRWDNDRIEFRTISFWKPQYQCQVGADTYMIYGHTGRKYSIFKNDVQIAWWDKAAVSWFAGDNYKIIADKDVDVDLVISLCLVIDNFSSDSHDGNLFTINLGNIGFQVRKFDPTWQPKY
jgi:uncharacterized protein YxjI